MTLRIGPPSALNYRLGIARETKRIFSHESSFVSPGRNKVSDEEVFAAVQRAMTRRGPHELTLAHIAAEAGVSPGRLVQRFGSKRGLLLTLAARFAGSAATMFEGLRAGHRRPLTTLRAYAMCMAEL